MDSQNLGNQFTVAFYRWALEDFRREIREGFPFLRRIKQRYLLFRQLPAIESLPPDDQQQLASALVKRFHAGAARSVGETISAEEWRVYDWYMSDIARIRPEEFRLDPQMLSKVNRKQFAALLKEELEPVLGDDVEPFGQNVWRYWTPIRDLTILTYVDVGGQYHQLMYSQALTTRGTPYTPTGTSILAWLGISSQTMWNLLTDSDTSETAKSLALLCSHFMHAVPSLLDGLVPN